MRREIKGAGGGIRTHEPLRDEVSQSITTSEHRVIIRENIDDDLTPLTGLGDPRLSSLCYFCLTRIILLFFFFFIFFLFDVNWDALAALALELKGHFEYAVLVT